MCNPDGDLCLLGGPARLGGLTLAFNSGDWSLCRPGSKCRIARRSASKHIAVSRRPPKQRRSSVGRHSQSTDDYGSPRRQAWLEVPDIDLPLAMVGVVNFTLGPAVSRVPPGCCYKAPEPH